MNHPQLDKAREWARLDVPYGTSEVSRAAERVIQSLPDQWIDAEKVRELLHWREVIEQTPIKPTEAHLIALLHALLTPSLPTLAELIEQGNDPEDYQWMQCNVEGMGDDTFVIAFVGERVNKVLLPDGMHEVKGNSQVTPRPDLPRLKWPGSGDAPTIAEQENVAPDQVVAKDICNNEEESLPRPEDVPAGEAWRVKLFRDEVNALKTGHPHYPWSVSSKPEFDGRTAYSNAGVTLISRLVPEVKP